MGLFRGISVDLGGFRGFKGILGDLEGFRRI